MKYSNTREAAEYVAKLMLRVSVYDLDCIVFVPSDSGRVRSRGFDHAKTIAQYMSRELGVPVLQPLMRIKSTRQVGASRRIRKRQIQEAFSVRRQLPKRRLRVLLIDDVMSTGATIEENARLLRLAGAKRVYVVVAAVNT